MSGADLLPPRNHYSQHLTADWGQGRSRVELPRSISLESTTTPNHDNPSTIAPPNTPPTHSCSFVKFVVTTLPLQHNDPFQPSPPTLNLHHTSVPSVVTSLPTISKPHPPLNSLPHSASPRRQIYEQVAERTGLEPATSGVTGRRSNRLNYRSIKGLGHLFAPEGEFL